MELHNPATPAHPVGPTLAEIFVRQYAAAWEADSYSDIDLYEGDEDFFDPGRPRYRRSRGVALASRLWDVER